MRLKDIEHNFGSNVARMVEGLSDSLTADPHHKESSPERKKAYNSRLASSPGEDCWISEDSMFGVMPGYWFCRCR